MSERLDNLPENQLEAHLSSIETSLHELKVQSQTVSTSNVSFRLSDTGDPYDWTGLLLSDLGGSIGNGYAVLIITATAESQNVNFGDVIGKLYVGSMSNQRTYPQALADFRLGNPMNYFVPPMVAAPGEIGYPVIDTSTSSSGGQTKQWAVYIYGDLTSTFFAKFWVVANDDVEITVTRL